MQFFNFYNLGFSSTCSLVCNFYHTFVLTTHICLILVWIKWLCIYVNIRELNFTCKMWWHPRQNFYTVVMSTSWDSDWTTSSYTVITGLWETKMPSHRSIWKNLIRAIREINVNANKFRTTIHIFTWNGISDNIVRQISSGTAINNITSHYLTKRVKSHTTWQVSR